jgi:DNA processing protein
VRSKQPTLFEDPQPRGLQNTRDLYRLLSLPELSPRAVSEISGMFDSWDEFLAADPASIPGRSTLKAKALLERARTTPEPVLPDGVRALSKYDPEWPAWLSAAESPPLVVFVRGTLPDGDGLAVVGTRSPSSFGVNATRQAVRAAQIRNLPVVSGLARGVDALAHHEALRLGLTTWAILGSGVDVPTPRENIGLAERILDAGGGLLSEQLPGASPSAGALIARNRLQVAAARFVAIGQCGIPSGTLHTARFALLAGKPLFAATPTREDDLANPACAGNRALLDPAGCDPAVLQAGPSAAARVADRRPCARGYGDGDELAALLTP